MKHKQLLLAQQHNMYIHEVVILLSTVRLYGLK